MDAPQDLAASNIQTENTMLTWKPPRADITGYMLSFESADRTIRVSTQLILLSEGQCNPTVCWVFGTCSGMFVSSFRRWCWVRLRCHTTWLSSKHPPNIQSACRPSLDQREAEWSLLSSPPVSRLLHTLERFQVTVMSIYSVISNARTNRIYSLFTFSFRDTELSW